MVGESDCPDHAGLVWPVLRGDIVGGADTRPLAAHPRRRVVPQAAGAVLGHDRVGPITVVELSHFSMSGARGEIRKVPRAVWERVIDTLCYAA